jgi:CubicO group peptidase (beta-lactamase class C family)
MRSMRVLAVVAVAAFSSAAAQRSATPVYPGVSWERITNPDSAGWAGKDLDSARARLSRLATTGFMAIADGRVLLEYGDVRTLSYLASARKSVLSMLFGKYVANGTVRLDKTLAQIGIDDIGGLTPQEREATVRDLLTARSGVYHAASNLGDDLANAPARGSKRHGTYQLYSNWDFNAVGTIFERETGRNIYDALESDLARPLGMEDFDRAAQQKMGDTTRSVHLAYHMFLSTRDMARLGYLMLREGNWKGRQLVPREWVVLTTHAATPVTQMNPNYHRVGPFGYGYLWWVWDGAAAIGPFRGAYTAQGAFGQYITVLPAVNLVIAHKTRPDRGKDTPLAEYLGVVDIVLRARCHARPRGIEAWCDAQAAREAERVARARAIEKPVTLTAAQRAVYVGTYTFALPILERTLIAHIDEDNGQLVSWAEPNRPKVPLIPLGNHVFGTRQDPYSRLTFFVEGGRAVRVRLEETGMTEPVMGVRRP